MEKWGEHLRISATWNNGERESAKKKKGNEIKEGEDTQQ